MLHINRKLDVRTVIVKCFPIGLSQMLAIVNVETEGNSMGFSIKILIMQHYDVLLIGPTQQRM